MKKLILVRHGKSSWADPDLDDHDRPLNDRGRRASPVIARWLEAREHLPDLTLCSSSLRTKETAALMIEAVPAIPPPIVEPGLYHASPDQMRARIATIPDTASAAMLVGHNPGLSALARKLAGGDIRPRCARAFQNFPTAAAAVFAFDVAHWAEIAYHSGDFVDFARPKELVSGR